MHSFGQAWQISILAAGLLRKIRTFTVGIAPACSSISICSQLRIPPAGVRRSHKIFSFRVSCRGLPLYALLTKCSAGHVSVASNDRARSGRRRLRSADATIATATAWVRLQLHFGRRLLTKVPSAVLGRGKDHSQCYIAAHCHVLVVEKCSAYQALGATFSILSAPVSDCRTTLRPACLRTPDLALYQWHMAHGNR